MTPVKHHVIKNIQKIKISSFVAVLAKKPKTVKNYTRQQIFVYLIFLVLLDVFWVAET